MILPFPWNCLDNMVQDNAHKQTAATTAVPYPDVNSTLGLPEVQAHEKDTRTTIYSREEIAEHCHRDSCWIVVNNRVYDVTSFLKLHPGGEEIILEYGGHDATTIFIDTGHSSDAHAVLGLCFIGEVTKDDWIRENISTQ